MIIPEKTSKIRKFMVPTFLFRSALAWAVVSSLLLGFMVYDYIGLLHNMAETKSIRVENARLVSQLERLQSKMVALDDSLDRVNLFAKKLKTITHFGDKPSPIGSPLVAIGPLTAKEAEVHEKELIMKAGKRPKLMKRVPTSKDLLKLHRQLELLSSKADYQEQSLQQLKNYLDQQADLLGSTPSIWPTRGWLTSRFGYRRTRFIKERQLHKGVDIAAYAGTEVRATADGVITEAGYRADYGKVIVIDHGYNLSTLYGHNSSVSVKKGDRVKRGQLLGRVGNTGRSTGSHLHYEVRVNGVPVNPMNYLLN